MNLLLNVFTDFWESFLTKIQMTEIIVALCLAVVGVAVACLGRRVARVVRKSNEIEDNDPVLISFKAIGIACLFISILIIVLRAGV